MFTEAPVSRHQRHEAAGPRRARWLLALALIILLVPLPRAEAFPIPPQTLWDLTRFAELVVWADVEEVSELPPPPPSDGGLVDMESLLSGRDLARLKVREVWKGTAPEGGRVEVRFPGSLICPAPPRYEQGLAVVAFLARDEKGHWFTLGLSYGTRYPTSNAEAEAYKRAITQAHEAHEQEQVAGVPDGGAAQKGPDTDWQVLAASHPATRWDGLYGLVPQADEDHFFYDNCGARPVTLTQEQQERLARGFVEYPPLERDLPMMLAALRGYASAEVDRVAASALETVLAKGTPPYWAELALDLLRERHGEKVKKHSRKARFQDPLLRNFNDKSSHGAKGLHPLQREWRAFKMRHKLEPERLPLPVESPVPGTGGDTPL